MKLALKSFLLTLSLFVAGYLLAFPPTDPRVLYNMQANPGGILFLAVIMFLVYGTPIWGVIYLIMRWLDRRRSGEIKKDLESEGPRSVSH